MSVTLIASSMYPSPAGTTGRVKLKKPSVGSMFVPMPNELWKLPGFTSSSENRVVVSVVDQLMLA